MIHAALVNSQEVSMALSIHGTTYLRPNLNLGRTLDGEYLPCLEAMLSEHDLTLNQVEGWSVALGPGSFAGIRFALALVKGIASVTSAKTRGIPDSYALVHAYLKQHPAEGRLAVVTDARCNCAFVTVYDYVDQQLRPVNSPILLERNRPWPEWIHASIYLTATPNVQESIPESIAACLQTVPPAQAQEMIDADEQLFPWLQSPDIEPLYVRPAAVAKNSEIG